jgi:hypothetical protein
VDQEYCLLDSILKVAGLDNSRLKGQRTNHMLYK